MSKKKLKYQKADPPKVEETYTLCVLYDQHEDEHEDGDQRDSSTSTFFKGAILLKEDVSPYSLGFSWSHKGFKVPKAAFEEPRAHVYAVVGFYSDGDTFHHSSGNMHIVDVYGNLEKANAVADMLRKEKDEANASIFGSKYHVPWGGYFSRLESIQVEVLAMLSNQVEGGGAGKNPDDLESW